ELEVGVTVQERVEADRLGDQIPGDGIGRGDLALAPQQGGLAPAQRGAVLQRDRVLLQDRQRRRVAARARDHRESGDALFVYGCLGQDAREALLRRDQITFA